MRRKGYNFIYLSPVLHRKINHNEKGGDIEMVRYSSFFCLLFERKRHLSGSPEKGRSEGGPLNPSGAG